MTLASMPCLLRRKSTERIFCLCPPPIPRLVIRPWALRPPDFFLMTTRFFSGRVFVMSSYDAMVIYRVDGVKGLKLLTGIKSNNPSLFSEVSSHHSLPLESFGYRFDKIVCSGDRRKRSAEISKCPGCCNMFFEKHLSTRV